MFLTEIILGVDTLSEAEVTTLFVVEIEEVEIQTVCLHRLKTDAVVGKVQDVGVMGVLDVFLSQIQTTVMNLYYLEQMEKLKLKSNVSIVISLDIMRENFHTQHGQVLCARIRYILTQDGKIAKNSKSWILLDTFSTFSVSNNSDLVSNVRECQPDQLLAENANSGSQFYR